MVVHYCGISDIGNHRRNNEDAWWAGTLHVASPSLPSDRGSDTLSTDAAAVMLVVSDGVGGANAGEVASRMAVTQLPAEITSRHPNWGDPTSALETLRGSLEATHGAIRKKSSEPGFDGMCTTVSLVCLAGVNRLWWGQAGDSRIYLLRAGRLQQISRDHSPVGRLHQAGALTEAEARSHPLRHQIDQSLGHPHSGFAPDVDGMVALDGDVLLLCSDGLSDGLWERAIEQTLGAVKCARDVPRVADQLVAAANRASGRDNITVVVARLEVSATASVSATPA